MSMASMEIDQIRLNRMVQGIEERGAFFSMFDAADEARRRELLRTATRMAEQAGLLKGM